MNAQLKKRANEQPHEQTDSRINDQRVHRALTGEKGRTKNRVNESAKADEQLNDRVGSSFVCSHKRLKRSIS